MEKNNSSRKEFVSQQLDREGKKKMVARLLISWHLSKIISVLLLLEFTRTNYLLATGLPSELRG